MSELTKEHFEESLKDLVTNKTLDEKLTAQTSELKQYVNDSFEKQQEYMETRFEELGKELNLTATVLSITKRLEKVEEKLGIK